MRVIELSFLFTTEKKVIRLKSPIKYLSLRIKALISHMVFVPLVL